MTVVQRAIADARALFLRDDNYYGCAETTFVALKRVYNLPAADDSAAGMALNGGVAYGGGICGAISGAAMAVGMLAAQRIDNHKEAKRVARKIIMHYMDAFLEKYHSVNCRDLIGLDIRQQEQHDQFIESGIWRVNCMAQIEFAMENLAPLMDERVWADVVKRLSIEQSQSAD